MRAILGNRGDLSAKQALAVDKAVITDARCRVAVQQTNKECFMESTLRPASAEVMYRMAWTAYVKPVFFLLVVLAIGGALVTTNEWAGPA
jgi:hypothetical protein